MPRGLVLALVFTACASAGVWPEQLGKYHLKSAAPAAGSQDPVELQELGFSAAEQADYGVFQVKAEKFRDTTGAYAASLLPSPDPVSRVGNYLISCHGSCPKDLAKLADASLPGVSHSAVPTLSSYLPLKGLLPHSERYIIGPATLRASGAQIPESTPAFQFGTEGEFALYKTPAGNQGLAIFSFPTPQMARQQTPPFEAIPGAVVKRTGPLVAVVMPLTASESTKSAALELLSQVNYAGSVAWNQPMPLILRPQTAAQMLIGIFTLAGVVIGFCFVSGLIFAGIRIAMRKFGYSGADGAMTTLHLEGK